MKTINNILRIINQILTRCAVSYIHNISKTLYPRPHLDKDSNEDNDDEPILFI